PIAQHADLVAVTPGEQASGYDWCFGCGALTITSITPGNGSLTIAFTSSLVGPTGGQSAAAAATTFTATCTSPTGASGTAWGGGSPITVTGLTAGATYSCSVRAADGEIAVASSTGATTAVVPLADASDPAAPSSGTSDAAPAGSVGMARTGADSSVLARAGLALLLLGGALVLVGRPRRRRPSAV